VEPTSNSKDERIRLSDGRAKLIIKKQSNKLGFSPDKKPRNGFGFAMSQDTAFHNCSGQNVAENEEGDQEEVENAA